MIETVVDSATKMCVGHPCGHWFTNAQGAALNLQEGDACPANGCAGSTIRVPKNCELQHRQLALPSGAFALPDDGYARVLSHARNVTLPAVARALGMSTAAFVAAFKVSAPTGGRSRNQATLDLVSPRGTSKAAGRPRAQANRARR